MRSTAPGSGTLAHSAICRYRHEAPRHIACQWFRGGAGAVVKVSGISTWCHRAHDGTGAPATSWPPTSRATDGLKQAMSATAGLTVNPGGWQVRGQSSRYRQKPAGTPGRTTKPSTFESLIALPPAGSAFFSLVFFAEAKKSDRRPPQGGCRMLLGAKTNAAKKTPTPTAHHSPHPSSKRNGIPPINPIQMRKTIKTQQPQHPTPKNNLAKSRIPKLQIQLNRSLRRRTRQIRGSPPDSPARTNNQHRIVSRSPVRGMQQTIVERP